MLGVTSRIALAPPLLGLTARIITHAWGIRKSSRGGCNAAFANGLICRSSMKVVALVRYVCLECNKPFACVLRPQRL